MQKWLSDHLLFQTGRRFIQNLQLFSVGGCKHRVKHVASEAPLNLFCLSLVRAVCSMSMKIKVLKTAWTVLTSLQLSFYHSVTLLPAMLPAFCCFSAIYNLKCQGRSVHLYFSKTASRYADPLIIQRRHSRPSRKVSRVRLRSAAAIWFIKTKRLVGSL